MEIVVDSKGTIAHLHFKIQSQLGRLNIGHLMLASEATAIAVTKPSLYANNQLVCIQKH